MELIEPTFIEFPKQVAGGNKWLQMGDLLSKSIDEHRIVL